VIEGTFNRPPPLFNNKKYNYIEKDKTIKSKSTLF
jgi:hypothetical protein